jgi:hypothetical protein
MPGHTAFLCPFRPRKPLRSRKALKRIGRIGGQYAALRELFFAANPGPIWYCYYCVYIGQEIPLEKAHICVEHYYSKARHPELRFDVSNLVASCHFHNKEKASLNGPDYLEKLDEQKGNIAS